MRARVFAAPLLALTLLATVSTAVAHTSGEGRPITRAAAHVGPAARPADASSLRPSSATDPGVALRPITAQLDRLPDGLGLVLALAAGVLTAVALGSRRHARRLATSSIGLLLLAFVLESVPHLVHHALDPDDGAGCRVLQMSERIPVVAEPPETLPGPAVLTRADPPVPRVLAVLSLSVPRGRAPPA